MKNYYWSMESWGSDYPPKNADAIISKANELIEQYAADHDDDETAAYSEMLWERFCETGFVFDNPRYKLTVIGETPLYYSNLKTAFDCQARYQARGKIAFLTGYDPSVGDYTISL